MKLKIKVSIILLSAIFFGFFGFLYNKNLSDNWQSRYDLRYNATSLIYLKSLDHNFKILKVTSVHSKFEDHINDFIKKLEVPLGYKYKNLRDLKIANNQISFKSDSLKDIEQIIDTIIADLNKLVTNHIKKRLDIFLDIAESSLSAERALKINELTAEINFYEKENIDPSAAISDKVPNSIIDNAIGTIEQIKEGNVEEISSLVLVETLSDINKQVYQYKLNLINLKFLLEEQKRLSVDSNFTLKKINALIEKLEPLKIIKLTGLKQRYNTRPNSNYSIASFGILGMFFGIILIFLMVNLKNLKKLMLKML